MVMRNDVDDDGGSCVGVVGSGKWSMAVVDGVIYRGTWCLFPLVSQCL